MPSPNKQDARESEALDITAIGHAGLANVSQPITAYDLHVRYNDMY